MNQALAKAIASAGSTVKLSKILGVTSQAISQWKRIPAERVLDIERATGVSRHELRPDIYPIQFTHINGEKHPT